MFYFTCDRSLSPSNSVFLFRPENGSQSATNVVLVTLLVVVGVLVVIRFSKY